MYQIWCVLVGHLAYLPIKFLQQQNRINFRTENIYPWYLWSLGSIADFLLGNFEVSGMNGFFYNLYIGCLQSLVKSRKRRRRKYMIHEGLMYQKLFCKSILLVQMIKIKRERSLSWTNLVRKEQYEERNGGDPGGCHGKPISLRMKTFFHRYSPRDRTFIR